MRDLKAIIINTDVARNLASLAKLFGPRTLEIQIVKFPWHSISIQGPFYIFLLYFCIVSNENKGIFLFFVFPPWNESQQHMAVLLITNITKSKSHLKLNETV
jgi:hypothetical protein